MGVRIAVWVLQLKVFCRHRIHNRRLKVKYVVCVVQFAENAICDTSSL